MHRPFFYVKKFLWCIIPCIPNLTKTSWMKQGCPICETNKHRRSFILMPILFILMLTVKSLLKKKYKIFFLPLQHSPRLLYGLFLRHFHVELPEQQHSAAGGQAKWWGRKKNWQGRARWAVLMSAHILQILPPKPIPYFFLSAAAQASSMWKCWWNGPYNYPWRELQ